MSDLPCRLHRVLLLGGCLVTAACGCGGPGLVPVSGTVTRKGKPLAHLRVNFVPEGGRASWGMTDEQGRYALQYERNRDGAFPGNYKVFVRYAPKTPKEEEQLASGQWNPYPDWPA